MSFLDFLKPKPARHPDARTHEVAITGRRDLDAGLAANSRLRRRPTPQQPEGGKPKRGMWVTYLGKTGILIDMIEGDLCRVQVVEPLNGHNQEEQYLDDQSKTRYRNLILTVPADELRQAWLDEIPRARWAPHPKTGEPWIAGMQAFGYERAP